MLFLVNFACKLGIIMVKYDFLDARWVILAMFERTSTWLNLTFGQTFCGQKANYSYYSCQSCQTKRPLVQTCTSKFPGVIELSHTWQRVLSSSGYRWSPTDHPCRSAIYQMSCLILPPDGALRHTNCCALSLLCQQYLILFIGGYITGYIKWLFWLYLLRYSQIIRTRWRIIIIISIHYVYRNWIYEHSGLP